MAKKAQPKKKPRNRAAAPSRHKGATPLRWYWRYSLVLALIGVTALLWMSLLTYSPDDLSTPTSSPQPQPRTLTASMPRPDVPLPVSQPQSAPAKRQIRNAVGIVGAHTANALLHYIGGGVFAAVLLASLAGLLLALRGNIAMFGLRVLGAVLLVAAISCALYLLHPSRADATNVGPAGVLGVQSGQFLKARFALSGAWTIVIVAVAIASVLTAGRLLITVPAKIIAWWRAWRQAVAERRAARQQALAEQDESDPATQSDSKASEDACEPSPESSDATDASHAKLLEHIRQELEARLSEHKPDREGDPSDPPLLAGEPALPADWVTHDLPSRDLLVKPETSDSSAPSAEADQQDGEDDPEASRRQALEQALAGFGIAAQVVGQQEGPSLTMFELALAPGVKVAEISNLAADLARSLGVAGVRVVSPLPRRDTIGLEVPRSDRQAVYLHELMQSSPAAAEEMALPLYLGKDAVGRPIIADLAEMPHMLIAGTTGSGKSVCMNSIILGLMLTRGPSQVRMVMVDPKMVEMAAFEDVPHLLCPVISDMSRAAEALAWAAARMDDRYRLLKRAKVRNIADFNRLDQAELRKRLGLPEDPEGKCQPLGMPYIVVIVDEMADLVMTSGKEVQTHIIRIAQKARAVGIHLVLATQRPSADVVTGLIKSNVSCRLSFQVASRLESRIVLDQNGADVLLGKGDMLLLLPGSAKMTRGQGTFVHDKEIHAVAAELTKWGAPRFSPELAGEAKGDEPEPENHLDKLFEQAVEIVLEARRGTASLLQRRLQLPASAPA